MSASVVCQEPTAIRSAVRPSTLVCDRYAVPDALTVSMRAMVASSSPTTRKTTRPSTGSVTISNRPSARTRSANCVACRTPFSMWVRNPDSP